MLQLDDDDGGGGGGGGDDDDWDAVCSSLNLRGEREEPARPTPTPKQPTETPGTWGQYKRRAQKRSLE